MKLLLAIGTLLAAVSFGLPAVANAAPAGPVDLGTLPGDRYSFVAAINAGGTMVGDSYPNDPVLRFHPAKWDSQGHISALPTLGGERGSATAVDDAGVAVGWAWDADGDQHAVRWAPDGSVTALPGTEGSDAAAISETGVVVGGGVDPQGKRVSLRWEENGAVAELEALPGGGQTTVTGITADGSLTSGTALDSAGNQHAVRWNAAGDVTDLSPGNPDASAAGINNAGVVTGTVTVNGWAAPVIWDRDGRQVPLGWPASPASATPRAINDAGMVVGSGYVDFAENRAVRWTAGAATVLESDRRSEAVAVDAAGTAVGNVDSVAGRWAADGTFTNLGTLPDGDYSWATGIGAAGTVIGQATTSGGAGQHAVYWPAG